VRWALDHGSPIEALPSRRGWIFPTSFLRYSLRRASQWHRFALCCFEPRGGDFMTAMNPHRFKQRCTEKPLSVMLVWGIIVGSLLLLVGMIRRSPFPWPPSSVAGCPCLVTATATEWQCLTDRSTGALASGRHHPTSANRRFQAGRTNLRPITAARSHSKMTKRNVPSRPQSPGNLRECGQKGSHGILGAPAAQIIPPRTGPCPITVIGPQATKPCQRGLTGSYGDMIPDARMHTAERRTVRGCSRS